MLTSITRLCDNYGFEKPNDIRALNLMNAAAIQVMSMLADLVVAYGVSDEYSFVFHKSTNLFERRACKLVSTIVSTFTAVYVHLWPQFFLGMDLVSTSLPTFDGRAVCYPSLSNLRDYLSWRQVDCKRHACSRCIMELTTYPGHINNLYNTTFWALVQKCKMSNTDAENLLKGTVAADKNELLFSRFSMNYNNEPEIFRRGSIVFRDYELEIPVDLVRETDDMSFGGSREHVLSKSRVEKSRKTKAKAKFVIRHLDIIKDEFWEQRPWITNGKLGRAVNGST